MANKRILVGAMLGLVGLTLVLALILPVGREARESGRDAPAGTVGVIRIEGVIMGEPGGGWMSEPGNVQTIMSELRSAQRDEAVRSVVIRINSPGGSSAAAQEIVKEVQRLRQSGKKVVVSMGDVAASAGYWIAAPADTIVANPSTLTGSIGVIMMWQNFEQLLNKLGIDSEVVKSGPYKDIGSPVRAPSDTEKEMLQGIVDDTYRQFLDDLIKYRTGKISPEKLAEVADGRVLTGRQAYDLGLVDEMGNFYDAVQLAGRLAGIEGEPELKEYTAATPWERFFSRLAGSLSSHPTINMLENQWRLLPGEGVSR